MSNTFEWNTKETTDKTLRCICGSTSLSAKIYEDDYGNDNWVHISCKKCGKVLFYNGA